MRTLAVGVGALLCGTFLTSAASAQQCPKVTGTSPFTGVQRVLPYGATITVTANGAMLQPTGGAYDTSNGSDDILVCVINAIPIGPPAPNSQIPLNLSIYSLDLSSGQNIFGFDGDGIGSYGVPTNAMDPSDGGYGGPNAYFSNINSAQTAGRVNFKPPIAPGGTAYFSLENQLAASTSCANILKNSIPAMPTLNAASNVTSIVFTPQGINPTTGLPYTLAAAAQVCGFLQFNWQSTITNDPPPNETNPPAGIAGNDPGIAVGAFFGAAVATPFIYPATPYNDPPSSGYVYQTTELDLGKMANAVGIPVYFNIFAPATYPLSLQNAANSTANTITFFDAPTKVCFPGAQSQQVTTLANNECGGAGVRAAAGSHFTFVTHVVGVGIPGQAGPGFTVTDTGVGFQWMSNFNGTTGGNTTHNSTTVPDPGSGTGGITVASVSQTPTYTGTAITAINGSGNIFGPNVLLSAVLPESRSAQPSPNTVTAFATIINTGATTATSCSIAPAGTLPVNFVYQTTNPSTNALTGSPNTPVNIPGNNGSQSFVIAFTPTAAITPTNLGFNFQCSNTAPAPIDAGLNTLLLSASTTTATPDVIALAATLQNDGIVHVTNGSPLTGVFAVATDNLGSSDTITVATNTGTATLPITVTLCQSNPATGACLQTPSAKVSTPINSKATPTFAIFVSASNTVPFDPANNRIFLTFTDSTNAVRGQTSVAVETQ